MNASPSNDAHVDEPAREQERIQPAAQISARIPDWIGPWGTRTPKSRGRMGAQSVPLATQAGNGKQQAPFIAR